MISPFVSDESIDDCFVPVKAAEQQAALTLVGLRNQLIRNRTQLPNAIVLR